MLYLGSSHIMHFIQQNTKRNLEEYNDGIVELGEGQNRELSDGGVSGWDLRKRRKNFRDSSCPPADPGNPCKTRNSPLHKHHLHLCFAPEHKRVHVLPHLAEEKPIPCACSL